VKKKSAKSKPGLPTQTEKKSYFGMAQKMLSHNYLTMVPLKSPNLLFRGKKSPKMTTLVEITIWPGTAKSPLREPVNTVFIRWWRIYRTVKN
jgi:hypothetical protein